MTPVDLVAYLIMAASVSMVFISLLTRIVLATYAAHESELRRMQEARLYTNVSPEESDVDDTVHNNSDDD